MVIKKSKQSRRCNAQKARSVRWQSSNNPTITQIQFVLATLITGLTFSRALKFLTFLGRSDLTISEKVFYGTQKFIQQDILKLTHSNLEKYRNNISKNTVISIDGNWDHRRNGKFCVAEAIDLNQNKIIAYSIVDRPTMKNKEANFKNAEKQKTECATNIINMLSSNQNITGYVHDLDAKTKQIFSQKWNISEFIDPNHSEKSFIRKFEKYNSGKSKIIPKDVSKVYQAVC